MQFLAANTTMKCLQIGVCSVGNIRRPRPGRHCCDRTHIPSGGDACDRPTVYVSVTARTINRPGRKLPASTMAALQIGLQMTADPAPADCGHTCHVAVKAKDYIFHPYQKR